MSKNAKVRRERRDAIRVHGPSGRPSPLGDRKSRRHPPKEVAGA